jgi:elongation factor 1-gamma
MVLKYFPYDEARYNQHIGMFERAAGRVEAEVKGGKKFLVGEKLTLADIMVVGVLQAAAKFIMDKEMLSKFPGVEAYLKETMELPEIKGAFGSLELMEKRAKPE